MRISDWSSDVCSSDLPCFWVMHVAVFGGDVVVAQQYQFRITDQLGFQPFGKSLQPAQFVLVLFRADALAIGEIGAYHTYVANAGRDDALLLVLKTRHAHERFGEGMAAQDSYAVIGFLPAMQGFIPRFTQCVIRNRKSVV